MLVLRIGYASSMRTLETFISLSNWASGTGLVEGRRTKIYSGPSEVAECPTNVTFDVLKMSRADD